MKNRFFNAAISNKTKAIRFVLIKKLGKVVL